MAHITEIRVHWADTDKAGIVHHANFFRWFEEAEIELFRESGKTRKRMAEDSDTATPRLSVRCDYFFPAYYDEIVEVRTAVLKVSEKTYHLRHEVHRPADGKRLATGEVVVCCVRAGEDGTFQSHPLSEEMVAALRRYSISEGEGAS
ncbi:MAG: acyl-CoA thioesterase [Nitrospinota bacterium]